MYPSTETYSKIVRPYSKVVSNQVAWNMKDELDMIQDPMMSPITHKTAYPVDIERSELYIQSLAEKPDSK